MKAFGTAGYDVVYWGAAGRLFDQIKYSDGKLISPAPERSKIISSGRYGHLPLSDFDAIIFYGMAVRLSGIAAQITGRLKTIQTLSKSFVDETLAEQIAVWWDHRLGRELMKVVTDAAPSKKFIFTTDPLVAENPQYLDKVKDNLLLRRVLDELYAHCSHWCEEHGISFYRQSNATLAANGVTTDFDFNTNSVKMEAGKPHPEDDFVHMNSRYGDVVLADLLALLEADRSAARAAG
ncbi:hypothetical protein BOO69_08390 [Sulfitobacter alexandrii]|uniref:SGNH/GDSL hydrolase family protein n=2 Tax=Sulfitobacter alexandrii TaxID=1917485 RepID=A0A1J0WGJ9_9RHOB|nr:hypothetical protein BOO69_08390 [Sulfitobacter alexandrii]